jgi:M6 family metalloprotease-like protein
MALAVVAVVCLGSVALAVPADPTATIDLVQPDGKTVIKVKPMGDERNGVLVTADGYTVVKGSDGWYHYATRGADGKLTASKVRASAATARSTAEIEFLNQTEKLLTPSPDRLVPTLERLGKAETAALVNRSPQTANNVLIIMIQFPDRAYTYPSSEFEDLMDLPGFDYYGSVNDFYNEASYGTFGVSGTATTWYMAANNHSYYGYNTGDNWEAAAELTREAILAADADGVDFSLYDNDGNGYVDGLFIVHSGPGAESGYSTYPWSHAWSLTGAGLAAVYTDGVTVNRYSMEPESSGYGRVRIGVFCHEYGHVLGLPDLYDTDYSSDGVGNWCVMGGGSWNGPSGYGGISPSQFSAWCRAQLGWVVPVNITEDQLDVTIPDIQSTQYCARLWKNGETGGPQYFLVEYRQGSGFDAFLPGCGLAIWHVDETQPDNTVDYHRLVDLEEMDGTEDNTATDVWLNGTFGTETWPNSLDYDGAPTNVEVVVKSTTCVPTGLLADLKIGSSVDTDQDGYSDPVDNCPSVYNPDQADRDGDDIGDVCDDSDADGIMDAVDNCWAAPNPNQEDNDLDGVGNACCCGIHASGVTGNADCSTDGKRNLADITVLIDRVYISHTPLCCESNGNTSGDLEGRLNLEDITRLIDLVYISQTPTENCQ